MQRYQKYATPHPNLYTLSGMLGGVSPDRTVTLQVEPFVQSLEVEPFLNFLNGDGPRVPGVRVILMGNPTESEVLRGLIDEWLDSGKADDGDDPRRRDFKRAKHVQGAAHEYSMRGKLQLLGVGNSLHLWIDEYEAPKSDLRPILGPSNESYAKEQLVFFLLSSLRYSLARCRTKECGTYFQLKQWKRLYRHGTLCDVCQRKRSQESAKRATAQEREDVRVVLHVAAAKRFRKEIISRPQWYSDDALKRKVAKFLSVKFGDEESFCAAYPKGITGKWVANVKNWKPIQVAANGGK